MGKRIDRAAPRSSRTPLLRRRLQTAQRRLLSVERLEERSLLATMTWVGGSGANWSNGANWVGGIAPQAGDNLLFPAAAASFVSQNDLADGIAFNTIEISGSGYAISSAPGAHTIQLAGGLTANNATGTNTFAVDITLQNAQTVMNANPSATLNLPGKISTGNIIGNYFQGTSALGSAPALVFDGAGLINTTGEISGAGSISKLGSGTVILGGNNTYEGHTEARQGFIRVTSASGLGSAITGHTDVQAGAAVELSGAITSENFVIREGGVGFGFETDTSSLGALRAVGGATSAVNNVELVGGNNLVGATINSKLIVNGQVMSSLSNSNRFIKVGPGTVQFAGSQDNVYRGETRVLAGTLELNKSAGKNAIVGDLIIGDNIGGDNAAVVRLLQSDQIADTNFYNVTINSITLNSSGLLDLGANSDLIGNVTLTTGAAYSADITTSTGTLTLGGNLTVNNSLGSSGASPAATIGGKLDLGTFFSGGAAGSGQGVTRTFNINDTQHANLATDLNITAVISGDLSITKTGTGTLRLSGANTFTGPFILNSPNNSYSIVEVANNAAFGAGLVSLQQQGNNSIALRAIGGSRTIANTLSFDAPGNTANIYFLGDDDLAGTENFTFTGPVTLTSNTALYVPDPAQTVTFTSGIGEGMFGSLALTKAGRGTLALQGANTYSGNTTINNDGGTLILRGAGSILNTGTITVGIAATLQLDNNTGGNLADRVSDAASVNVSGRLQFIGSNSANSSELIGAINPATEVASTIEVQNSSSGAFSSVLVGSTLAVGNNRPTRFVGTGLPLTATGANRLSIINNPGGLVNGIVQQGVLEGPAGALDFATYDSSPEGFGVVALPASAYVTDINLATSTSNVRLSSSVALSTNRNISALLLDPGVNLSGGNAVLTVSGGSVIQANNAQISVGSVNFGGGGLVYTPTNATATISGDIYSAGALRKHGPGKLILSGDSQYTGQTQVNDGVLNVQRSSALGSSSGDTIVRPGAALELEQTSFGPIDLGLESVTANGTGGVTNLGSLRNIAGNNSIAGTLTIDGNVGATNDVLLKYGGWMGGNSLHNAFGYVNIAAGSSLDLSGAWTGNQDMLKIGGGTFSVSGVNQNPNRSTRIYEGTLLLNREPGLAASGSFGTTYVGSDVVGAPAATVRLARPDQLRDDNNVNVFSTGALDLNGQSDRIAGVILAIGPAGAGNINIGGSATLTLNGDINVFTLGTGNTTGGSITGGNLALQLYGTIAGAGQRTFHVNDGATGDDLTITSAIVDGTGLQSVGVIKTGFGTLVFGGTTANTMTGVTQVNEGELVLAKPAGVNAHSGQLTIGDASVTSGFERSDVLRWRQANQLPDFMSGTPAITVNNTGLLDLNGFDETIGSTPGQNALSLFGVVQTAAGTLTINGNIVSNAAQGAGLWTPISAAIISGNLNLGSLPRTIDVGGDRGELPFELDLSANISGTGGLILGNSGTLLLRGNNSALSGDIVRTNGSFAVGSDSAFGAGRVLMNGGYLTTYGGKRTLPNEFQFTNTTIGFIGGNNTMGLGAIGGGGNSLTFAGPVSVTAGNWFPTIPIAGQVEFAGGLGETYGPVFTRSQGFGTIVISSASTLSGNLEIGQDIGGTVSGRANGGHLILRDNGSWLNGGSIVIGYGGTLEIDNSGIALPNRIGDAVQLDLYGGTLALRGKAGAAVSENLGRLRIRSTFSSVVQSLVPTAPGSSATWRFTDLNQEAAGQGSTIKFVGRGTDITATGSNRLGFNALPALTDGIVPFTVLQGNNSFDFLTVTNATPLTTPIDNFVGALTSGPNFATTLAGATGTVNVKLSTSEVVAGAIVANALLLANGNIVVSGGGSLNLDSGLLASSGASNVVSVNDLVLGVAEGHLYVDRGDLTVSSAIGAAGSTASLANGGQGTLVLAGNNAFTGTTRIISGTVRATSNTAFGSTAGNVVVYYGATLELANNISVPAESLTVNGAGESSYASVGLKNVGGTNTWQGTLQLDQNRTALHVEAGTRLIVTGTLNSGNGWSKTGQGTLELSGAATGNTSGASTIWQGTVELGKTAGNAINNSITVGDNVGGPSADKLILLANNQLPDGNGLTITSTGQLDVGAYSDVIGSFSLQAGLVASGTITGTSGALILNGNASIDTITNSGGGSYGPATIAGNLALQASGGAAVTRTLTVNDTLGLVDAMVTGSIIDGDGNANLQSFTKAGAGRLLFQSANTFSGLLTVSQGELVVAHPLALGDAGTVAAGSGTVVNSANSNAGGNASLLLQDVSIANEGLRLGTINNNGNNGTGYLNQGALRNVSGINTWSGDIAISTDNSANFANVTINVDAGQLILSNAISQLNNTTVGLGLTKIGSGTLTFTGSAANTYTGPTLVSEGKLQLGKNAGINAIAGQLTVGNDAGGQDADIVELLAANQIADTAQVQVTASGHFSLNGNSETLGNAAQTGLNLFLGVTTFPRVSTGAGVLTLATGVGVQSQNSGGIVALTTASPGATISGNVTLGGNTIFNAVDAGLNIRELVLDATLTGTAGWQRSGTGIVVIGAANAGLSGPVTLNSGGGLVVMNNGLGSGTVTVATNITTSIFGTNYLGGAAVTQTISNNFILNTAATASTLGLRGDDNLVLSGSITNAASNNVITANMQAGVSVTLSGTINLSGDATNRTLTVNNNTFGGGANSDVVGGNVNLNGQIVNGGGSTASALTKGGVGLAVISNNANNYGGQTLVAGGVLRIASNNALGATAGNTQVNSGTQLQVVAGLAVSEPLNLNANGFGFGNLGSLRLIDLNAGLAESTTWSGSIALPNANALRVDGGTDTLELSNSGGNVISGAGALSKFGKGTLTLSGTAINPLSGGLFISDGVLLINKSGTATTPLASLITVGDGGGSNDSDILRFSGTNTATMLSTGLTVGATGWFDLGTNNALVASLILTTGPQISGNVTSSSGVLTVVGDVTVNTFLVTDATSPAAEIGGNLAVLGGNFNIADTFVPSANDDLIVSATITATPIVANGGYYPGLREGRLTGGSLNMAANPGTTVQLFPRLGETNAKGPWGDNETWVYTGEIYDADGIFSFAENIDDWVNIVIDGVQRLNNLTYNQPSTTGSVTNNAAPAGNVTTNYGMGPLNDGWHTIEIRVGNGGGGAGAVVGQGWGNAFGLGLNSAGSTSPNGSADGYIVPIDNGAMNLFRIPVAEITTVGGATLTKAGAGSLNFQAATPFTGTAAINAGQVTLSGTGSMPNVTAINVAANASLILDNSAGVIADRVNDAASISLTGATLGVVSHATAAYTEAIGTLNITAQNGLNSTYRSTTSGTGSNLLSSTGLVRNGGANIDFMGEGSDLGSAGNQLQFTGGTNPFVDGVMPYATITGPAGYDLVTDGDGNSASAPYSISRVTTYTNNINTVGGIVKLDGTEPAANRVLTASNSVAALLLQNGVTVSATAGTLTIGSATAGLIVNSGGANIISAPVAFAGLEELILVQPASSLEISGVLSGSGTLRKERGGNLILSGNNTLTGAIQAHQGTIIARNSNAFGTTAGGVNVLAGATLVLDGNLTIGAEQLDLQGTANLSSALVVETLQVINGNSTWGAGATTININGNGVNNNVYIDVAAGRVLTFNATVQQTNILNKIGAGELVLAGTASNAATVYSVNEGLLTLNKSAAALAVNGTLTIDDIGNFDPVGAGTVRYASTAGTDQIGNVGITINNQGVLDFNGKTDATTGTLTISGGSLINTLGGGAFQVGALTISGGLVDSSTGSFNLAGTLTYNSGLNNSGSPLITGTLDLIGGTRSIAVNDGYFIHNDLTIDARITNGRIAKSGAGALLLTNASNTFLAGIDEEQTLTFVAPTFNTTTFTLTFNGNTTATISYQTDAATTAANIQAALEALPNIGVGGVLVSATTALVYKVTFTGILGSADLPNVISGAFVTAGGATALTGAQLTAGVAGIRLNAGILAFSQNNALGSARLHIDNNAQLLPVGGDRNLANAITINPSFTVTLGGRTGFGGTDDLLLSGPITLIGPTSANVVNLDVNDPDTLVTMSGVISGGGDLLVPVKRGNGTLVWSGNNTFDVRDLVLTNTLTATDGIRVEGGILRVAHSNALGTSAELASVNVRGDLGAVLEIDGSAGNVNIAGRIIELVHQNDATQRGFLNQTSTADVHTGILRSLAGDNSITGQIRLRNINDAANAGTMYIGVDAGSLNLDGAIVGMENDATATAANNRSIFKTGTGTLRYSGATANTYTGTTAVMAGTLELNKTPDVADGGLAFSGVLQIGDNVVPATVRLLANEQLPMNFSNSVNSTGTLDLNGFTENSSLTTTLVVGQTSSAQVLTGAAGNWVHRGDVTVTVRPGIITATTALIAGNLQLTNGFAAQRVYTINPGPAETELLVTANITDGVGFAGGINKAGAGRMFLAPTGTSTYTGTVTVSGGALRINSDASLGATTAGTTVNSGAALELIGGFTEASEALTIAGTGIINTVTPPVYNNGDRGQAVIGSGALRSLSGLNVWQGTVTMVTNDRNGIAVDADELTITSVLAGTGGNAHLVKSGLGTLELAGAASNTFSGNTYLQQGTLRLNKQAAAIALNNGEIFIGDNSGPDNSDVLLHASTAGGNQIGDRVVRVARTGLLNLNGVSETINQAFFLGVGAVISADIATGAGVLSSNNTFTVVNQGGTNSGSVPAVFSGIYDLAGATRNIDVREGNAPTEFDIQAVVQVTGGFGINKLGLGSLRLSGNNTYSGLTSVNFGTLEASHNNALGTVGSGTNVASGATLALNSTSGITVAEALTITPAYGAFDSIVNIAGNNTLTGTIGALSVPVSTTGVRGDAGTLTLAGVVAPGGSDLRIGGVADTIVTGQIVGGGSYAVAAVGGGNIGAYWPFNETSGTTVADAGPNGRTGTLQNSPALNQASALPFLGSAISFNGSNQYISTTTATNLGLNGSFTASAWVNAADLTGDRTIFGTDVASTNLGLHLVLRAGKVYMGFHGNDLGGNATLSANTWYHITWRYDATVGGGTQAIFINGALDATGGNHAAFQGTTTVNIGRWNNGNYFLGSIDEPAIFNRALSDGEIAALYGSTTSSSVTKIDAGTLTLAGANTYTGPTTVAAGTLLVNGSIAPSSTTVEANAILAGTGTTGPATINSAGNLNPGILTTGVLTTGDLVVNGNYNVQLNGGATPVAGTDYDQTIVSGTVDLTGGALLLSGTRSANNDGTPIVIIVNDGGDPVVGNFNGLSEGALVQFNGILYTVTYTYNSDAGPIGNDVALIDASPQALYWDADGSASAATGGTGTWDTSSLQWRAGSLTGPLVRWNNINNDDAIFPANAGVVSIQATGVTARSLAYLVTGYTLQSNTLTFGPGSGNVDVIAGATASITAGLSTTVGVMKLGGGTLNVASNNSYASTTTISAGMLQLGSANALGNTAGNTVVVAGATLDLNGFTLAEPLVVNGAGVGGNGALVNSNTSTVAAVTANFVNSPSFTIGGAGNIDISSAIANVGSFTVTKVGAGTLTLSGVNDNSYLDLQANAGTVILNKSGAVSRAANNVVIGGATVQIGAASGGDQIFSLLTVNSGTFDLNTKNETLAGVILAGGTITGTTGVLTSNSTYDVRNGAIAARLAGTVGLTKSTAGTVTLSGINTYAGVTTINAGTLTVAGGSALLDSGAVVIANVAGAILNLTNSETIGSLTGGGATGGAVTLGANTLTLGDANTTTFSGGMSGTGSLIKQGSGTLILSGTNTYSGSTTVNAGILRPTILGAIATNVTVTAGGTFDTNGLNFGSSRDVTIAGTGAAGQIGALINSAGGSEGWVRNLTLSGAATIGTTAAKLNIGSAISGVGQTLTVAGTGETNFRADNAIANLTNLVVNTTGGGRLRFESSQTTPTTNILVNSGGRIDTYGTRNYGAGITLTLSGGSFLEATGAGGNTATWNGPIIVTGAASIVANQRLDFFGVVSGAGSLTKTGGDVFNVRGGVSGLSGLTINQGRVRFEGTGFGAWAGPITVNTSGILSPYGNGGTSASIILGGGALADENNGTATYSGNITVNAASFIDTVGGSVVISGPISGSGGLSKVSAGTATFSNTSLGYTGATSVNAGTLLVNGSIANSPTTVASGGTLGGSGTVGLLTVNNGGNHAPGNNGVGFQNVNGNYNENGQLSLQIGTPSGGVAGTDYDQLRIINSGSVIIGGSATLSVVYTGTPGTFAPAFGQLYAIIDNDGNTPGDTSGTFAGLPEGSNLLVDGQMMRIFYHSGDGNDLYLVAVNGAPPALYVNDQWTTSAVSVDGDLEQAGTQSAFVGVNAFDSIASALAAYPTYAGPIIVNGGVYASAPLTGGGNVTLRLVRDLVNNEPNVTLQNITGDAGDSIVTRYHNIADANLVIEQGSFAGGIAGAGDVTKSTSGSLALSGSNSYSGSTTVAAGTLLVHGTLTGSGAVAVQGGATLGGDGSITGAVSVQANGTLSPGGTPGDLATGNLTFVAEAFYRVELINNTFDQTIASGVTLAGATLQVTSNIGQAASTTFVIIDNTGANPVGGTFAGLNEGASFFINGYQYFITYVYNGNDVAIIRNQMVDAIADNFGPILVNTSFTGNSYTNDNDPDGDARSTVIAQPLNGKVFMDPATGQFTYTPKPNFTGTDSFTYRLSDGEFNDTATVEITVVPMLVDGSGALQVSGTTSGDNIIVQAGSVRYNNVTYPLSASRVVVHGGGGNDTISVTASNIAVEFYGDDGDDYLSGGSLNDILDGGAGTDRLLGNAGNDHLYGGGGSDNLSGGIGNDYLSGDGYLDALGNEQQAADAGKDTLSGDAGDDEIHGGAGMDTLLGGIGNDYLSGGADGDAVDGGDGHDILLGDGGGDKLYGRAGNDMLIGGEGLDTLLGDTGLDLIYGGDVTSSLDETTLRAIALQWFTPATQTAAVNQFVTYKQDDLVSDTLNGEADDDWYLIFAKDLIATTERFPGNRKTSL